MADQQRAEGDVIPEAVIACTCMTSPHEETCPEWWVAWFRAVPLVLRMEAMGMERADPFEVFTAGDGDPAIRGRSDLWAEKK